MISKIIITLAVIMVCMWMLSSRRSPELREVSNPAAERNKKAFRLTAIAFMLLMLIAASVMVYLEFDQQSRVVVVNVVNIQSGATKSYRVKKNDIHESGFTTVDGTQVFVAEIERIEIEAAAQ